MNQIVSFAKNLHADESGELPVGSIMLIALVVVPIVLALKSGGTTIKNEFQETLKQVDDTWDWSFL